MATTITGDVPSGQYWRSYLTYSTSSDDTTYTVNLTSYGIECTGYNINLPDFTGLRTIDGTNYTFDEGRVTLDSNGAKKAFNSSTKTVTWSKGTSSSSKVVTWKVTCGYNSKVSTCSHTFTVPALASFNITFRANGSVHATKSCYYGKSVSDWPSNPSKSGYTFKGWYTASSGGTKKTSSSTFTAADTLYAQWTPIDYTLTLKGNGGTIGTNSSWDGSGTQVTKTLHYEDPYGSLPYSSISYPGYKIRGTNSTTNPGWFTTQTGSTRVTSTTTMPAANTTIWAQWDLITYNITYELNGGTANNLPATYNVTTSTFTLPTPTRPGYSFAGWTGSNGSTAQTTVTIAKGSTGNKSYTANWNLNSYTITFDAASNGGTTSESTRMITQGSAIGTLPTATKTNATFSRWATAVSGGSAISASTVPTGNTTYYAQFTDSTYQETSNIPGTIEFDNTFLQDYNNTRKVVAFGMSAPDSGRDGLIVKGSLMTNNTIVINPGVAVISGQLDTNNITQAMKTASYSNGCMGSFENKLTYTAKTPNIPTGWYNYLYIPHRSGGNNGGATVSEGQDNCNYGSMILMDMTATNGIYRLKYSSGTINSIEKFYTTTNKPTAADIGAVPTSRTVNSKALSSDISLTASDVGAVAASGGTFSGTIYHSNSVVFSNNVGIRLRSTTDTGTGTMALFMSTGNIMQFGTSGTTCNFRAAVTMASGATVTGNLLNSNGGTLGSKASPFGALYTSAALHKTGIPGSNTQAYAACWFKSADDDYFLCRPSSSRKVKKDIEAISDEFLDPHKLYDLRVVQFRYKTSNKDDPNNSKHNPTAIVPGFIAEEVAEIYPAGGVINDVDEIDDWDLRTMVPPMLALIQEQHKEIEQLKKEVQELKNR